MKKDAVKKASGLVVAGAVVAVATAALVVRANKKREIKADKADPRRTATGGACSNIE